MTLTELANKETTLYASAIDIYNRKTESNNGLDLNDIFSEYKIIHEEYAKLSDGSVESLKRGLFLQWYSNVEPNYLTGISELDEKFERKIIINLKKLIDRNEADDELISMLNYYLSWDWVFEKFIDIVEFKIADDVQNNITTEMETDERGQMGVYWKSVITE